MDYGFNIDAQLKTGLRPHKDADGAEIMAGLRPYPMAALTPLAIEIIEIPEGTQTVIEFQQTLEESQSAYDLNGGGLQNTLTVQPEKYGDYSVTATFAGGGDPSVAFIRGYALGYAGENQPVEIESAVEAYTGGEQEMTFSITEEDCALYDNVYFSFSTATAEAGADPDAWAGASPLYINPPFSLNLLITSGSGVNPTAGTWPMPQLVQMQHGALYAVQDALYSMADDYELTAIDPRNAGTPIERVAASVYEYTGEPKVGAAWMPKASANIDADSDYPRDVTAVGTVTLSADSFSYSYIGGYSGVGIVVALVGESSLDIIDLLDFQRATVAGDYTFDVSFDIGDYGLTGGHVRVAVWTVPNDEADPDPTGWTYSAAGVPPYTLDITVTDPGYTEIPTTGIDHGGIWHVADAGGAWYASNGEGLLACTRAATTPYAYAYSWADSTVLSVCIHEDTRLLTVWLDSSSKPQLSYGPAGGVGVTRTVPLPFDTADATILPLGNRAIVYGDNAVCGVSYGQTGDGAINYGFQLIPGIPGVKGRTSAVCVADEYHIVLDSNGALWRITPDFKAVKLGIGGYVEFLASMTSPVLTLDEEAREVWISNGTLSYLLTEAGLGGPMAHCPNGFLTGRKSVGAGVQTTVQFKSGLVGKDRRDVKTVTCAHVASQNLSGLNTTIYGRTDTVSAATRRSKTVNCSPSGMAFPTASFVEGQVIVNGTIVAGTTGRIENVELRKINSGKRDRRGPTNEPESD